MTLAFDQAAGGSRTTRRGAVDRPTALKERILVAAIAEFSELGYHRSSLRSISERSHATKPMVYYHFQGKDGLYAAAVSNQLSELEQRLREHIAQGGAFNARLEAFARTYTSCFLEEYPGLAVGLRELPTLPSPLFAEIASRHSRQVVALLKQILRDGEAQGELRPHDVDNCAHAIIGIMHYYIRSTGHSAGTLIEAATAQVVEYYAVGLLSPAALEVHLAHRAQRESAAI